MTETRSIYPSSAYRWICALFFAVITAACGSEREVSDASPNAGRVITPELWAGAPSNSDGGPAISGPFASRHPVSDRVIQSYEYISDAGGIRRRQLFSVTREGEALGRVLDQMPGLPERHFEGDVVFPLGRWEQGERREFEAVEHTLFGPALRRITLEIAEIDYTHDGIAHSLRYRLTVRDEANRILSCEVAVFSPGKGKVVSEANGIWQGCHACPCPT